MVKTIFNIK